jgi:uncharacterized membrane protein YeaQ/YmgE (transglycosylase-associated protein family)
METRREHMVVVSQPETWIPWPVSWSAIWVGALAALALALLFGLVGIALGFHLLGPSQRIVDWRKFSIGALLFSVCGAFFAGVVGGWVAGKIAGTLRSEPAMLHGAIVWLVTVPLLLTLVALGAGSYFGSWYGGLAGQAVWATPPSVSGSATTPALDPAARTAAEKEAARVARNSALGAVTALLLGLIGSVIGGWMASGEPMTFTYYRTRQGVTVQRTA